MALVREKQSKFYKKKKIVKFYIALEHQFDATSKMILTIVCFSEEKNCNLKIIDCFFFNKQH